MPGRSRDASSWMLIPLRTTLNDPSWRVPQQATSWTYNSAEQKQLKIQKLHFMGKKLKYANYIEMSRTKISILKFLLWYLDN